ncbi:RNA polymerase sigma-I factor [Lentibacillus lipolyticus]|nr:RNA polymerase sigma-I factor [Lentibacillus lipolyticus]
MPEYIPEEDSLETMIAAAQKGDHIVQNYLLTSYKPFIAKCVSEVCKRYIDPKYDDEFSIGFTAFHDAIMSYAPERGSSFLSFAKLVIKRKVIDYIRFVQKTPVAASLDENDEDDQMENPAEVVAVKEIYREKQKAWYLREEILEFKEQLQAYKLSFEQLTIVSPKHKDARQSAIAAAKALYEDADMRAYVKRKKKLPIKDLTQKVKVSKKTLERNRKFILAIFIILLGDYAYLKEYLKGVGS